MDIPVLDIMSAPRSNELHLALQRLQSALRDLEQCTHTIEASKPGKSFDLALYKVCIAHNLYGECVTNVKKAYSRQQKINNTLVSRL